MFHVPELARDTSHPIMWSTNADGNNGVFVIPSPEPGWRLWMIASDGMGWEHVSVRAENSKRSRIPKWVEMAHVKRIFWDAEDVVMQLHPRESEYVNCHPHVLHLWRPTDAVIPTPPPETVGPLRTEAIA